MMFFLGAHHPNWLAIAGVPLFVSTRRLQDYRKLPRAAAPWALDSGAFTEISQLGHWSKAARVYACEARRYQVEVGQMLWASIQDWMCEPFVLAKTGLSVEEHQRRTVASLLTLRSLEPSVPWIPVLQGWKVTDYFHHCDMYEAAGIDLRAELVVGIGSVCRRQGTATAETIVYTLAGSGLRCHAFGAKVTGLRHYGHRLASADSLAWSYNARRNPPLPGHESKHKNCANCLDYALMWRSELLGRDGGDSGQLSLAGVA